MPETTVTKEPRSQPQRIFIPVRRRQVIEKSDIVRDNANQGRREAKCPRGQGGEVCEFRNNCGQLRTLEGGAISENTV